MSKRASAGRLFVLLIIGSVLLAWLLGRSSATSPGSIAPGLLSASLLAAAAVWARRMLRDVDGVERAAAMVARGERVNLSARMGLLLTGPAQALREASEAVAQRLETLSGERNQAMAIIDGLGEGVVAVDPLGRVLLINPAARMLLGLGASEWTGQSAVEVIRHPEIQEMIQGVLRDRQRSLREVAVFQPRERRLRVQAVPCDGAGSAGPSTVLVFQDMTEAHRYEQLRKEFVANVSHELKSPLTSIRSLTETLLHGALDDPSANRRFVQLIDQDAERLTRLIDDLLALSQIESQAVPLNLATVELRPLVQAVVDACRREIAQRRLTVTVEVAPELTVPADPDRLRQVLDNLIDNAIKYNRDGGQVTITAAQDGGRFTISIADTGVGIPAQDLGRIFERFYRVDKARSRELGGTGLGLSIVKHIVDAHGGGVSVESRLQHGSIFRITLPATR